MSVTCGTSACRAFTIVHKFACVTLLLLACTARLSFESLQQAFWRFTLTRDTGAAEDFSELLGLSTVKAGNRLYWARPVELLKVFEFGGGPGRERKVLSHFSFSFRFSFLSSLFQVSLSLCCVRRSLSASVQFLVPTQPTRYGKGEPILVSPGGLASHTACACLPPTRGHPPPSV